MRGTRPVQPAGRLVRSRGRLVCAEKRLVCSERRTLARRDALVGETLPRPEKRLVAHEGSDTSVRDHSVDTRSPRPSARAHEGTRRGSRRPRPAAKKKSGGIPTPSIVMAASDGELAAVKAELKKGADVNAVNRGGGTALHQAACRPPRQRRQGAARRRSRRNDDPVAGRRGRRHEAEESARRISTRTCAGGAPGRGQRNGNINWDGGHEILAGFLGDSGRLWAIRNPKVRRRRPPTSAVVVRRPSAAAPFVVRSCRCRRSTSPLGMPANRARLCGHENRTRRSRPNRERPDGDEARSSPAASRAARRAPTSPAAGACHF